MVNIIIAISFNIWSNHTLKNLQHGGAEGWIFLHLILVIIHLMILIVIGVVLATRGKKGISIMFFVSAGLILAIGIYGFLFSDMYYDWFWNVWDGKL